MSTQMQFSSVFKGKPIQRDIIFRGKLFQVDGLTTEKAHCCIIEVIVNVFGDVAFFTWSGSLFHAVGPIYIEQASQIVLWAGLLMLNVVKDWAFIILQNNAQITRRVCAK